MIVEEVQCLLKFLKYYSGSVDNISGKQTIQAIRDFQSAEGLASDGTVGTETEEKLLDAVSTRRFKKQETEENIAVDFWTSIKYFKRSEFKCKCGGKYCNGYPGEMEEKLIRVADRVREHFGKPVIVSSGLRDPKHNAAEGGVSNSRHNPAAWNGKGKAMDFCVSGFSSEMVLAYVKQQPEIRYCYAINSNYVHMDIE